MCWILLRARKQNLLLGGGLGLLLLFLLVHRLEEQILEVLVLNLLLGLDVLLDLETGDLLGAAAKHEEGAFELSNVFALVDAKHRVGIEKTVEKTLLDAKLGHCLVLEVAETERDGGVAVGDLGDELASLVGLELMVKLEVTLVDGGLLLGVLGLGIGGGHHGIDSPHLVGADGVALDLIQNQDFGRRKN